MTVGGGGIVPCFNQNRRSTRKTKNKKRYACTPHTMLGLCFLNTTAAAAAAAEAAAAVLYLRPRNSAHLACPRSWSAPSPGWSERGTTIVSGAEYPQGGPSRPSTDRADLSVRQRQAKNGGRGRRGVLGIVHGRGRLTVGPRRSLQHRDGARRIFTDETRHLLGCTKRKAL